MLAEIERYMNGEKSIEELINEKFPQIIHPIEYL
jgi:hypothetical protein